MPNYYLTREGELVPEGDEKAAFLAHREGTEPDDAYLETVRKGLAKELRDKLAQKAIAPPETKEVKAEETEDKGVSPPTRRRQ